MNQNSLSKTSARDILQFIRCSSIRFLRVSMTRRLCKTVKVKGFTLHQLKTLGCYNIEGTRHMSITQL